MGENEKRVLYLNLSIGFCHETTATASDIITRLGWRSHPRFYTTATEDCSLIETKFLRNYDVIIFYTTGELPLNEDQKRALLDFVREGKGFVGIHSAIDTFYQWHEYGEMIGGYFNGHPWHQKVGIIIEDKDHPATRHLGDYWEVVDEIYQAKDWTREKVRVLLRLDPNSVDISKGAREDHDYALAWCRNYGKGRVLYTALGHPEELWRDTKFQEHLLGAILWAMGILPGDATPRPKP